MVTRKKKVNKESTKKRLIVSFEKLPEKAQELFNEKYEEGFSDYIQNIIRPNGTHMYVVPFETEDTFYMVKVDVVVDSGFSDEDLDKDEDSTGGKSSSNSVDSVVDEENGKGLSGFQLKHGDYCSIENIEERAREDMNEENFTSLDDIDAADEATLDL